MKKYFLESLSLKMMENKIDKKEQIKEEAPFQINKDIEFKFKDEYLETIKKIQVNILQKVAKLI